VCEKKKKERKREYNVKKRERENTTGRRESVKTMISIGPQWVRQRELHPATSEKESSSPSNTDPLSLSW